MEWQLERHRHWLRIVLYYTLGKLVIKMGNWWTDRDTIQMIINFRFPPATSNFLVGWATNNTCPKCSLLLTENKSYSLQVRPSQVSVFPKVHSVPVFFPDCVYCWSTYQWRIEVTSCKICVKGSQIISGKVCTLSEDGLCAKSCIIVSRVVLVYVVHRDPVIHTDLISAMCFNISIWFVLLCARAPEEEGD
jgi:hypothetical protein